jgi:serine/threonine protein kinase
MSNEYELVQSPSTSLDSSLLTVSSGSGSGSGSSGKKRTKYDSKADVYSFGILMYVLLTEQTRPFGPRVSDTDILLNIMKRQQQRDFRPPIENEPSGKIQQALENNNRWYVDLM